MKPEKERVRALEALRKEIAAYAHTGDSFALLRMRPDPSGGVYGDGSFVFGKGVSVAAALNLFAKVLPRCCDDPDCAGNRFIEGVLDLFAEIAKQQEADGLPGAHPPLN